MSELVQREEIVPKPYIEKERYKCPFYGFYGNARMGGLIDQEGNQCALITNSYSPCKMETCGIKPDLRMCVFNTKENREIFSRMKEMRIFPKEFTPPNTDDWKGITLGQWVKYLTSL